MLVEKFLIFEEIDFLEFIFFDELICNIFILVFVYYKLFSLFVEGRIVVRRFILLSRVELFLGIVFNFLDNVFF